MSGDMFKKMLTKPDGRALILYGRQPVPEGIEATSPGTDPPGTRTHLRWHPLRGEWVAYASHRQNRTFLPPPEYNPLAPTTDPAHPTELPPGDYDVAVFENRFPTLTGRAEEPAPPSIVPTRPGKGACEVVVFTQDPASSLGALPLWHLELLLEVWADRYRQLGERDDVDYVMPFENRGVEVGVTLHHPHGQIYAYPFIPPVPARELSQQRAWLDEHGSGLLEDLIGKELEDGRRTLYTGERAVAWMPAFARYSYEVWIAPRRPAPSVADLDEASRRCCSNTTPSGKNPSPTSWSFTRRPRTGSRTRRRTCTSSSTPPTACRAASSTWPAASSARACSRRTRCRRRKSRSCGPWR
jgi:UDPglucose--hexose-1-phosphate uridylyltransferase